MPIFKSGIVIPPKNFPPIKQKGTVKYSWLKDWKLGDCIEIPTEREAMLVDHAVRKHGFDGVPGKIVRRKIEENDQTFYRMWRVA